MDQQASTIPQPKKTLPTIGLFIDWLDNQYKLDFINGVGDFARKHQMNLLCFEGGCIHSSREYEAQRTILFDLVDQENVDGLIIMSAVIGHFTTPDVVTEFCQCYQTIPVISIAMEIENIPSMLNDNAAGMRDLMNHLINVHGFSRIAFITGPSGNQDALERYEAYQSVLKEHGITIDDNLLLQGDFTKQSGMDAVQILIDERKVRFDVIVAASDDMALGALDALNARGIKVPEDVAVVGFDNLEMASYSSPALTTVAQPFYEQGLQAAEMIWNRLQQRSVPQQVKIPTKLILRDSCGCFSELTSKAAGGEMAGTPSSSSDFVRKSGLIAGEILKNIGYLFSESKRNQYSQYIEQMLESLWTELTSRHKNGFLNMFSKILRQAASDQMNLFSWHEVLSELRHCLLPYLSDSATLTRAETLWHQARIIIGEMAISMEKRRIHDSLENNQLLNLIREELLVTLNMNDLLSVLAKRLPQAGIKSCYMSSFNDDDYAPYLNSQLILAFNENGPIPINGQNAVFPSRQLVPCHILPDDKQYVMMVVSLNFAQTQFGFVLFDIDLQNVHICSDIRRILCSALQGVTLFHQIQEQAKYLVAEQEHLKNEAELRKVIEGFIKTIALTVETRDPYTAGHQFRVADLACAIGIEMGLSKEQMEGLRMASIVHDLGKIYIPVDILNKPGRLKDVEFSLIKNHPEIAYEILKSFEFPWPIAQIILQHHERLNGSGYPSGLKDEEINFIAKILAVADVIEAMASNRPYRPALGIEAALHEISANRGILYDPEIVDICLNLFNQKNYQLNEDGSL
jgi:HD-GYP domain-containing protein (c-di-GMP phosphodiesterase class II)/DNA-binding LacI/PurR family transcriptional regulator